jgi:hypothetical protein
VLSPTLQLAK